MEPVSIRNQFNICNVFCSSLQLMHNHFNWSFVLFIISLFSFSSMARSLKSLSHIRNRTECCRDQCFRYCFIRLPILLHGIIFFLNLALYSLCTFCIQCIVYLLFTDCEQFFFCRRKSTRNHNDEQRFIEAYTKPYNWLIICFNVYHTLNSSNTSDFICGQQSYEMYVCCVAQTYLTIFPSCCCSIGWMH